MRYCNVTVHVLLAALLLARAGSCAEPEQSGTRESDSARPANGNEKPAMELLQIGDELFSLEVALTPEQHEHGLMWRSEIPPDGGMLFVFPDERKRWFWMANTLIDLDLVFLDGEGRVVALHTMHAEPPKTPSESDRNYRERLPTYPSGEPARFAIEFKAGTLPLLKLSVGDRVPIDLQRRR